MASKLGLEIVWIDCNLDNYTINTDYLAGVLTSMKDVKAIVGVDLFGHTCDWDTIKKIAGNIPVVQDAAQSFGGTYKNKINGSYNDLTCFSFSSVTLICRSIIILPLTSTKSMELVSKLTTTCSILPLSKTNSGKLSGIFISRITLFDFNFGFTRNTDSLINSIKLLG